VETSPLDLTGVRDDYDLRLPLDLPNGVEVVGDQTVLVQVGVAAIEGSLTLSNLPVKVVGLQEDLFPRISPSTVDVIISGPVPILERISNDDINIHIDLTDMQEGTYQMVPEVTLSGEELRLESILPSTIEVIIDLRSRITPTRTPTISPSPTQTPTPTGG
jgi:YbbR domain-containing protein